MQIRASGLATDAQLAFNSPQRPSESPKRQYLFSFLFVQDVGHSRGRDHMALRVNVSAFLRGGRFSGDHWRPVLGDHGIGIGAFMLYASQASADSGKVGGEGQDKRRELTTP
jgi:hypothetical protein